MFSCPFGGGKVGGLSVWALNPGPSSSTVPVDSAPRMSMHSPLFLTWPALPPCYLNSLRTLHSPPPLQAPCSSLACLLSKSPQASASPGGHSCPPAGGCQAGAVPEEQSFCLASSFHLAQRGVQAGQSHTAASHRAGLLTSNIGLLVWF